MTPSLLQTSVLAISTLAGRIIRIYIRTSGLCSPVCSDIRTHSRSFGPARIIRGSFRTSGWVFDLPSSISGRGGHRELFFLLIPSTSSSHPAAGGCSSARPASPAGKLTRSCAHGLPSPRSPPSSRRFPQGPIGSSPISASVPNSAMVVGRGGTGRSF